MDKSKLRQAHVEFHKAEMNAECMKDYKALMWLSQDLITTIRELFDRAIKEEENTGDPWHSEDIDWDWKRKRKKEITPEQIRKMKRDVPSNAIIDWHIAGELQRNAILEEVAQFMEEE